MIELAGANVVAMLRKSLAVLTVVVAVAALGGCSRELRPRHGQPATSASPVTPAADFAATLQKRVTADAMMAHLKKLQEIADANDGNRALGTPGYDASVDYVANALRDKGFDVQTPEFEVRMPFADEPSLTVGGDKVAAKPLEFTKGTPPEGVSGPLVPARVEDTPGCTASDYDGLPVAGAVVLVDRGKCQFGVKQAMAAERGAVALIVANNEDGDEMGGTLGETTDVKIPVISVTKAAGERLRASPRPHPLKLNAGRAQRAHTQRHRPDQDRIHRQRRDGRRASRQRARGARHQRQRLGRGGGAGNRTAAGQFAAGGERCAVRFLGRRGARPARVQQLRAVAECRRAQGHCALSEFRHARLAQPRLLHVRR